MYSFSVGFSGFIVGVGVGWVLPGGVGVIITGGSGTSVGKTGVFSGIVPPGLGVGVGGSTGWPS